MRGAGKRIFDLITEMRPSQWTKNLVVFAGLIFSHGGATTSLLLRSVAGFCLFCLLSGSIYILNDVADIERDRAHPWKKKRPVARGDISKSSAVSFSLLIAAVSLCLAYPLGRSFFFAAAGFVVLNGLYSLILRGVVLLDVIAISTGFVLRALAGVEALRGVEPGIEVSPWLLLCTFFLALFLAVGKRRAEYEFLLEGASNHRLTLTKYSPRVLDQMIPVVTASTVICYSIYTVAPGTVEKFHTTGLLYTVPFVLFGIFRYLYLVFEKGKGGNPSETLLTDLPLIIDILLWGLVVVWVIYLS
ncbi:MAG: decaprenyl-phosphate phosphoribosyltransferase [Candidatus Eisenbacteria bacterium]|nr:decaprenyl-phosphate phosphoribosyltransferase [Candidatus Eisenbacteria bacterium]